MIAKRRFRMPVAMTAWVACIILLLALVAGFSVTADGTPGRAESVTHLALPDPFDAYAGPCDGVIFRDEDPECHGGPSSATVRGPVLLPANKKTAGPVSINIADPKVTPADT